MTTAFVAFEAAFPRFGRSMWYPSLTSASGMAALNIQARCVARSTSAGRAWRNWQTRRP